MGDPMSFTAPRPPEPDSITALADALSDDIHYELSDNMLRGAADTYFSGKILARLGRVIVIASEMNKLASGDIEDGMYTDVDDDSLSLSMEAAAAADLPSDDDIADAVEQLKRGVEIWINGKAEAPYIYDRNWGGIVNCGCTYHGEGDKGICNNTFPECPALVDVNEDFGNGKTLCCMPRRSPIASFSNFCDMLPSQDTTTIIIFTTVITYMLPPLYPNLIQV
jgi:hypothetical protein